ncbi:MAG: 2-oxoglutarate dehydrogenase E1 component [Pseudomonadota bacterium]
MGDQASDWAPESAAYIAQQYEQFCNNPGSVDPSWQALFRSHDSSHDNGAWARCQPSWQGRPFDARQGNGQAGEILANLTTADAASGLVQATRDSLSALMLIRAFRVRGHLLADLDPLKLNPPSEHPELDPSFYGFAPADMDRRIFINDVLGMRFASMKEIIGVLRKTYCGTVGVQFMHIQEPEQKGWLQERIENIHNRTDFTERGRIAIYERLVASELFEAFLHKKFPGTKRFGLDGGESLVPALEQVMKRGGQLGVEEIVIGMSHRGRLNVLANVMGKPYVSIFAEFHGQGDQVNDSHGSGDVKYHLGASSDRDFDGNRIHLSLTANPSHLECVNPVVVGKVRAKQRLRGGTAHNRVMPVLMHGDAALAGQGIVGETLAIAELKGYRVGGTFHVVINNQIGFTTMPSYSRSGPYPTEIGLSVQAPIFHVNGDDPEAVVHVSRVATEFRQRFGKDVFVDMLCYRRFGHNEGDEPRLTQPLMYKKIGEHPTTATIYGQRLAQEGVLDEAKQEKIRSDFLAHLEKQFGEINRYKAGKTDWFEGAWTGLTIAEKSDVRRSGATAVKQEKLTKLSKKIYTPPERLKIHPRLKRIIADRYKMVMEDKQVDWAIAEALGFATLLDEGTMVRLSGQDSGRGTFAHRHAVLRDQETEEKYVPLNHLTKKQGLFEVHDSPLSEFAVLGFEYGFTLADPKSLVLWEAQFGDFANGAQIIFDQFISAGESKWLRMSGIVVLLPHGFEGQGPEHSSARLERFLQMSGHDNWQVIYPTTPANYFHALRRQIHRKFRKPLIIMSPKSLLRHKHCRSPLEHLGPGWSFHRVLYEDDVKVKKIRRLLICTGKIYYDLMAARDAHKLDSVTIVRLEQLYPFPEGALREEIEKYPKAKILWVQEEPENMGAWYFVDRRIEHILHQIKHQEQRPTFVGRPDAASPATGLLSRHIEEQNMIISKALDIPVEKLK